MELISFKLFVLAQISCSDRIVVLKCGIEIAKLVPSPLKKKTCAFFTRCWFTEFRLKVYSSIMVYHKPPQIGSTKFYYSEAYCASFITRSIHKYSWLVSVTHEFSQSFRFRTRAAQFIFPFNLLLLASPHHVPQQTTIPQLNQPRGDHKDKQWVCLYVNFEIIAHTLHAKSSRISIRSDYTSHTLTI
jgi:hypothetical protein